MMKVRTERQQTMPPRTGKGNRGEFNLRRRTLSRMGVFTTRMITSLLLLVFLCDRSVKAAAAFLETPAVSDTTYDRQARPDDHLDISKLSNDYGTNPPSPEPTSEPTPEPTPTPTPTPTLTPTLGLTDDPTSLPSGSPAAVMVALSPPPASSLVKISVHITPFVVMLSYIDSELDAAALREFHRVSDKAIMEDWRTRKLTGLEPGKDETDLLRDMKISVETEVLAQSVVDTLENDRRERRKMLVGRPPHSVETTKMGEHGRRGRYVRRSLHDDGNLHVLLLELKKTVTIEMPTLTFGDVPTSNILPTSDELDTSVQVTFGLEAMRESIILALVESAFTADNAFSKVEDVEFLRFLFSSGSSNSGGRGGEGEGGTDGATDSAKEAETQLQSGPPIEIFISILAVGIGCLVLAVLIYIKARRDRMIQPGRDLSG